MWVRDPDAVILVRGRGGGTSSDGGRSRKSGGNGGTDVAAISGPGDMSPIIEGDDVRRSDVEVLYAFARGGGGGRRRRREDGPGAGDRDGASGGGGGGGTGCWRRGGR